MTRRNWLLSLAGLGAAPGVPQMWELPMVVQVERELIRRSRIAPVKTAGHLTYEQLQSWLKARGSWPMDDDDH